MIGVRGIGGSETGGGVPPLATLPEVLRVALQMNVVPV